MLPDWAPNAHPLLVHFPIALFVAALVADIILLVRKKDDAAAAILYLAAGLGALLSFLSGRNGADAMMIPAHVVADLNAHADWGLRAAWFLGLFGVARVVLWRVVREWRSVVRIPLFIVALAGMYVVWETAEHGGRLVFAHGLGTADGMIDMTPPPPPPEAGGRLHGTWSWTPDVGLASLLGNATIIAEDNITPPRLEFRDGQTVLAIDGPSIVLIADTVAGVQVDVQLDASTIQGEAAVLHNATAAESYHYFRIGERAGAGAPLEQGVRVRGTDQSMSRASATGSGTQMLRVVSEGTHYRAYIDGVRVTHGHGDAAPLGRIGFRVGGGTLYVTSITATPIG